MFKMTCRLLSLLLLSLLVACATDSDDGGGGSQDVGGDADVGRADSGDGGGTPDAGNPDGGDVLDEVDPDAETGPSCDADTTMTECFDCACDCGGDVQVPYGGCFGPCDYVPEVLLDCSADCENICP